MDALTLLTADHNRVRGLFTRFKDAHEADDTTTATELATKIFQELDVHTTIEETVFYPAIDVNDEIHEMVVESLEEHKVCENLMEEARGLSAEDEHWAAKITVLIENVEHHAGEEESDMWPLVRKAMSGEQLQELGDKLEAKKRELGAPTLADKIDLTKAELAEKAKEQEIPGRSTMDHDELAATVAPD